MVSKNGSKKLDREREGIMTDSFIGMKGSTGIFAKVTTPGKKSIYLAYPETITEIIYRPGT